MRILSAAISVLLCIPLAVMAADIRQITVTGEGIVDMMPDMATLSLGVASTGPTAAEALAANSLQLSMVLEQLRAAGIEPRDLQTSGLSLNPNWQQTEGETAPRIMGYSASNMVTVRVRNLDTLGGVLDRAVQDGANSFNSLTFGLSNPVPALNEARARAVADAMARAKLLTEAAGLTLGPVVSIAEGGDAGAPQPMFRMDEVTSAAVPMAAGEISTTARVTMVFDLVE